jgi:MFS transporter, DHA1 family, multidrug resistance protein
MSELYGRRRPLYCGFFIFAIFQIPVAVAQNLETIFICRFLQGASGSAAQAITGGALTDIWTLQQRGFAMAAFSASLFMGPCLGPIVSVQTSVVAEYSRLAS